MCYVITTYMVLTTRDGLVHCPFDLLSMPHVINSLCIILNWSRRYYKNKLCLIRSILYKNSHAPYDFLDQILRGEIPIFFKKNISRQQVVDACLRVWLSNHSYFLSCLSLSSAWCVQKKADQLVQTNQLGCLNLQNFDVSIKHI